MEITADLVRLLARSWYGKRLTARAAGQIAADVSRLSSGVDTARQLVDFDDVPGSFERTIVIEARGRPTSDER